MDNSRGGIAPYVPLLYVFEMPCKMIMPFLYTPVLTHTHTHTPHTHTHTHLSTHHTGAQLEVHPATAAGADVLPAASHGSLLPARGV